MTKTFHISVLIIVFSTPVFTVLSEAQVESSIYSMYGFGQISDNSIGINRPLGGTGIAFQSGRSINYRNPASYLGISPGSFNMEFGAYSIYKRSENVNTSQADFNTNVGYIAASLYLSNRWTCSAGIVPFSTVNYDILTVDEIRGEPTSYEIYFTGTGRLSRIYLGNSFKIYKGLSAGCNASFILGPITQAETASGNESSIEYEIQNHHKCCFKGINRIRYRRYNTDGV